MILKKCYTFKDVLLVPKFSDIRSRKDVHTFTNLTKNITLNTPIISSNMDTITEEKMAIEMAMNGGIGIIHRFMSIDDQVNMVKNVKRYMNYKVTNPHFLSSNDTINKLIISVLKFNIHTFPVVDNDSKLIGIVNHKDSHFIIDKNIKIENIMKPLSSIIYSKEDIELDEAYEIMKLNKVHKLPLVDDDGLLKGLITLKDILRYKDMKNNGNVKYTLDDFGHLRVGAAIGVKNEDIERVNRLVENNVDVIVIDVAHGHHILVEEIYKKIRELHPNLDIIVGNIATIDAARFLCKLGVDAIKVGIGNGSICSTRIVTGCGVPQLTALLEIKRITRKYGIPIISDGGNGQEIGSIVKALAAGASTVMLGNFLSGTDETPGPIILKNNKKYKMIRGMASYGANLSRKNIDSMDDKKQEHETNITPEGSQGYVPYRGKVKDIINQIIGGIRSGMSYNGAHNLTELYQNAEFIEITNQGRKNSEIHSIYEI